MVIINGKAFSGSNVTIINGRVTSCSGTGKFQKFDEMKVEDCSDIDTITIDSSVGDVNVSVSNASEAKVHFYGEATVDGDVSFDVRVLNRGLRITLNHSGNCFSENLKLDITVPKKAFKLIKAESSSGSIVLNEGISTYFLKVKTQSGSLEANATVSDVSASTLSGNIDLYITAIQDVIVKASTMSGCVSTKFNNIGHINLSTRNISGNVINHFRGGEGFTADVDISTMSGHIKII